MIEVVLADDQDLIRRGLKALLKTDREISVVGEAGNGEECLALTQKLEPDLILMDIRMPVMDGVAATKEVRAQFPQVKVLILTTFNDRDYVQKALRAGASGYLLKDTPFDELTQAIRLVLKGYSQIGPGLLDCILHTPSTEPPRQMLAGWEHLTPRDWEIVELVAQGLSNREIASNLFLSEKNR